ncbi:hypothetical protein TevJSym_ak00160 [endosymbiont of Tevnia jerichonana (vent Tica)]|uniref:Uncharacterized protein n=1 Tax=endosymbiont of Tevnia jerichonana (vent Tica) TaxID=1049564 RepID=G2FF05_9GAMM|nr:hypothetical protein TevJSym_ak00160 [endosymbiont of Tevnia jerichonana (vent Tica)]
MTHYRSRFVRRIDAEIEYGVGHCCTAQAPSEQRHKQNRDGDRSG